MVQCKWMQTRKAECLFFYQTLTRFGKLRLPDKLKVTDQALYYLYWLKITQTWGYSYTKQNSEHILNLELLLFNMYWNQNCSRQLSDFLPIFRSGWTQKIEVIESENNSVLWKQCYWVFFFFPVNSCKYNQLVIL